MKATPLRILSIALLLVAFFTLSGIATTAAALVTADAVSSCCDCGGEGDPAGPCSLPECPCALCLTISYPAMPQVAAVFEITPLNFARHLRTAILSEYFSSIDYPPEA